MSLKAKLELTRYHLHLKINHLSKAFTKNHNNESLKNGKLIKVFLGAVSVGIFGGILKFVAGFDHQGVIFWRDLKKIWRESRHPAGVEWSLIMPYVTHLFHN